MYRQHDIERELEIAFRRNADTPASYQEEVFAEGLRALKLRSSHGSGERRILIIGGAGYIGSVMTQYLLERGCLVRCLDLLLYRNARAVLPFAGHPRYEFLHGDFTHAPTVANALQGASDVVMLAGLVGDPVTKAYPEASSAINDRGMTELIRSLNGRQLNKAVFISTCSNYGLIPEDETADENHEMKPLSLYAKAKVAMESLVLSLKGSVDYHPTILRFATAFGLSPRMRFDLTVNEFTREMFHGRDLAVYDAQTWRPYCHVRDFSRAVARVLEAPQERVAFEVFNAGGEANNSTKRMIVEKIKNLLPHAAVSYRDHGSDPRNYRVNFAKIRETLYFEPALSVDDGVRELLAALKQRLFDDADRDRNYFGNYEPNYHVGDVS